MRKTTFAERSAHLLRFCCNKHDIYEGVRGNAHRGQSEATEFARHFWYWRDDEMLGCSRRDNCLYLSVRVVATLASTRAHCFQSQGPCCRSISRTFGTSKLALLSCSSREKVGQVFGCQRPLPEHKVAFPTQLPLLEGSSTTKAKRSSSPWPNCQRIQWGSARMVEAVGVCSRCATRQLANQVFERQLQLSACRQAEVIRSQQGG